MEENTILTQKYYVNKIIYLLLEKIKKNYKMRDIFTCNPLEKIVPFNFWFSNKNYKTHLYIRNNQKMRIREFNDCILTPLNSYDGKIDWMNKFIDHLSIYQPFYPENFYHMWEIINKFPLEENNKSFLSVSNENKLGNMESLIFFHEKKQNSYQKNKYHIWIANSEKYDIFSREYIIKSPKHEYLSQAYNVIYLNTSKKMIKYDIIMIDNLHIFENISIWKKQERDLHKIIFYFLITLTQLKENGKMIIKINMNCGENWGIFLSLTKKYFEKHIFLRPEISNSFNPELYLILENIKKPLMTDTLDFSFLKNLHRYENHKLFRLGFNSVRDNDIIDNFNSLVKKWIKSINMISNKPSNDISLKESLLAITEWHTKNGLYQIKDMKSEIFRESYVKKINEKKPYKNIYNPTTDNIFKNYNLLEKKRSELNYFKRVMDTKPSNIFGSIKNNYDEMNFVLWEHITSKIEMCYDIRNVIKNKYYGEMVTNAWIKFYEILNIFGKTLFGGKKKVKSFHICEAPGAFISALNHYLSNNDIELEWYAQTLNPFNSSTNNALDDYFGLIKNNKNKWLFGIDNSGDITKSKIIESYRENKLLSKIDIMTADAGIHCIPRDLNEQESKLCKINMGQIICILACLRKGKSAIIKTFLPMTEPLTISMIYLLMDKFSITFTKPCASHSSNSEIYIFMRDYKGIEEDELSELYSLLDNKKITSKTFIFREMDTSFCTSYINIISELIDRQISSLKSNYYYYYNIDKLDEYEIIKKNDVNIWLKNNPIYPLEKSLFR